MPYVVEDDANHHLLLDPEFVCNEALKLACNSSHFSTSAASSLRLHSGSLLGMLQDLLRMFVNNLPQDRPCG